MVLCGNLFEFYSAPLFDDWRVLQIAKISFDIKTSGKTIRNIYHFPLVFHKSHDTFMNILNYQQWMLWFIQPSESSQTSTLGCAKLTLDFKLDLVPTSVTRSE